MEPTPENLPVATAGSSWQKPTFPSCWTGPTATPDLHQAATAWLAANDALIRPASPQSIERWLVALAIQCAGAMSLDEARMRATAYASTLADEPAYWFTPGTLKAAAKQLKWFPSVGELVEILSRETMERDAQVRTARRIVGSPIGEPPAPPPPPRLPFNHPYARH